MQYMFYLVLFLFFAIFAFFHKVFWQKVITPKRFIHAVVAVSLLFLHESSWFIFDVYHRQIFTPIYVSFRISLAIFLLTIPIMLYIVNRPHNRPYHEIYKKQIWEKYHRR